MRSLRLFFLMLASVLVCTGTGYAQSPEPDPEAMKAFKEVVDAWRAKPSMTIKSTVKVELMQGDAQAKASEKTAEFIFGPKKSAVIKLNGFTCYLKDGTLSAVHEKTDHSYFTMSDDGSPYYALMNCFVDIPFPELAIMLGEEDISEVCMQLHPKSPWIQPTAVALEDKDGAKLQHITFKSEFDVLDAWVDPETKLFKTFQLSVRGGDLVQEGATITYTHTFEYQVSEKPLEDSTFTFDPGQRQKVDMMSALVPRPTAPDQGGEDAPDGGGPLVGKPAPPMVLATMDGKAIDLEDLKGRVVVLDFWATWCGPCRAALPTLHEVAKWAGDQELPVTVITVNVWEKAPDPDERLKVVRQFWEQQNFTLPVAMDYSDETARAYGVTGIPATFIIRSDGVMHAQHSGAGPNYADDLKKEIQEALNAVEPGM